MTGGAKFIVLPSVWYEGFNRILLEGLAKGTPIIASNLGSMQAIIEHRRTGLLFRPNDPRTWSAKFLAPEPKPRGLRADAARRPAGV